MARFADPLGVVEFRYEPGQCMPSAMVRGGTEYALYYDQIGSLRAVADPLGNVVKEVLYSPFGAVIEDTNPGFSIPFGFAGGLFDRDLGFVRFGWRDYDTDTARWTAKDPIGAAGGDPDWYGYCLDDPINGVDPEGLEGGFGGGVKKIGAGLGKLWDKAPAGIGEAVSKGVDGAGEAFSKLGHAYATNKDLQKYTAIALGAGMAPIAAAGAVETVPLIAGVAMRNPDKLAAASRAAVDFANGLVEGPPPQSPAGVAGAITKGTYDWYKRK